MSNRGLLWIVLALIGLGLVMLLTSGPSDTVLGIESDRFAQMLYLGVLGLVIASGILVSNIRFGYAARLSAIWILIAIVLMTGYQYRYELQDVASRMTAGLVPGSPLSKINAEGHVSVMLERMANGHFEVRANVNGAPINVMLDTGATSTLLSFNDAATAGYDPASLSYIVSIMTANGEARAARVVADEIRVGDIVRSRVPVLVAEQGRVDQSLLGMNFIGTLSGFDMRGERLILYD